MTVRNVYRCPSCGWTGTRRELEDAHGGPECPDCGGRVLIR